MARALWLPEVLRAAGLTVHEHPGWQTRGSDNFDPYGVVIHHTGGVTSPATDIQILLNGSNTAPPPIAQLFLARTGEVTVVASGKCNHALTGRAGNLQGYGNSRLIGIEAANNGTEGWTGVQYQAYVRMVAAICAHLGWGLDRITGHKEHQPPPDKFDPSFDMGEFRQDVHDALNTPHQEDDMKIVFVRLIPALESDPNSPHYKENPEDRGRVWRSNMITRTPVRTGATLSGAQYWTGPNKLGVAWNNGAVEDVNDLDAFGEPYEAAAAQ